MLLDNKYYRLYLRLVARDDETGYRERHHKVPRALGGSNAKTNIVLLSSRKHFLVHWLLTKCTAGEQQRAMQWAFACMTRNPSGERCLCSWQYHRARAAYRDAAIGRPSNFKGRKWSPEQRIEMSRSRKGRKLSADHKLKIGSGLKGKTLGLRKGRPRKTPLTPMQIVDYAERMRGNKYRSGSSPSPETRAKLSAGSKGNRSKTGLTDSPDTKDRKRESQLRRPAWAESGFKGVSAYGKAGKYQARVKIGDRRMRLGVFDCPAAAHFAYLVAVDRHAV